MIKKRFVTMVMAIAMVFSGFTTSSYAQIGSEEATISAPVSVEGKEKKEDNEETASVMEVKAEDAEDVDYELMADGGEVTWNLDDFGTLTISGHGRMEDYSDVDKVPWYQKRDRITSVIIEEKILSIGSNAFRGCTNLVDVHIPNSITDIGDFAFSGCYSLTDAIIPDSVTNIGGWAFWGCHSLTSVNIPDGVNRIQYASFADCPSLVNVHIPNNVTSIEAFAFESCTSLTSINLPNDITTINVYTFYGCKSLSNVSLSKNITSIYEKAFYKCYALSDIYYNGSEKDWSAISIWKGNDSLISSNIHYNYMNNSIVNGYLKYNGHTYKVYPGDTVGTFPDAINYCAEKNGHLAVISSEQENDAIYNYICNLGHPSAYFGLSDEKSEGNWEWVTETDNTYTNWHSGEPNAESSKEDYAMFYYKYTNGQWNDGAFGQGSTLHDFNAFICEWDYDYDQDPGRSPTDNNKIDLSEIEVAKYDEASGKTDYDYDALHVKDKCYFSVEVILGKDMLPNFSTDDWMCNKDGLVSFESFSVVEPIDVEEGSRKKYIVSTYGVINDHGNCEISFTYDDKKTSKRLLIEGGEREETGIHKMGDFNPFTDSWSFPNSVTSFAEFDDTIAGGFMNTYNISPNRYIEVFGLDYYRIAKSTDEAYNSMIPTITNNSQFGGNCFGMAMTSAKIDSGRTPWSQYNEDEFANVNDYYYDIRYKNALWDTWFKNGDIYATSGHYSDVTHLIEDYQIWQKSTDVLNALIFNGIASSDYILGKPEKTENDYEIRYTYQHNASGSFVRDVLNYIKTSSEPLYIGIHWGEDGEDVGHGLLAYAWEKEDWTVPSQKGWYKIYVYDCNYPKPNGSMKDSKQTLDSCYSSDEEYIELNPSENKWRYGAAGTKAGASFGCIGCDDSDRVICREYVSNSARSSGDKTIITKYPDWFKVSLPSRVPDSFDGTARFTTTFGTDLHLSPNSNITVVDEDGNIIAHADNGNCICMDDKASYRGNYGYMLGSAATSGGVLSLPYENFSIHYYAGDDITVIGTDSIINLGFSGNAEVVVDTSINSVRISSETDNEMDVQLTNLHKDEPFTSARLDGAMKAGDNAKVELNPNDVLSAEMLNSNDGTVLDVYTFNGAKEGKWHVGTVNQNNTFVKDLTYNNAEPEQSQVENFISRLYQNFLGREPDLNGLKNWTDLLVTKQTTGAKVIYGFVYSPEFQSNPLSNEVFVTAMYNTIFGRNPDASGLNAWVTVLENGCTRKKVLAGFLNSDEMEELCDTLGILAGSYKSNEIVDQNTKVTYFVSRMYRYCLGREADVSGLASWVSALLEGRATGTKIATGFFSSPEMKQMNLSNCDFVVNAYVTLLDRQPDEKGLSAWVSALDSSGDRSKIVRGFTKSEEFGNLCAEYGIAR